MRQPADSGNTCPVKVFVAVVLVVAALPLLYAAIRGFGASMRLQRKAMSKLTHRQRVLLLLVIASELVFVGAGFAIGYGSTGSLATGAVAAFGGGCAWVILCWLVGGFMRHGHQPGSTHGTTNKAPTAR